MNRGEVFFVDHHEGQGPAQKSWKHAAVGLLPQDVVAATGHQVVLLGTLRSLKLAREGQVPVYPLEFPGIARQPDGNSFSTVWKPYDIRTVEVGASAGYATAEPQWDAGLSSRLRMILFEDKALCRHLKNPTGCGSGRPDYHRDIPMADPGAIVTYNNRDVLVLSNAEFQRRHPLALVIVAPILDRSAISPGNRAALWVDSRRVAYEFAQVIRPSRNDAFVIVPHTASSLRTRNRCADACLSMWKGALAAGSDSARSIEYFAESAQEIVGRSMAHLDPWKPTSPTEEPLRLVTGTVPFRKPGRAFTGPADVAAGTAQPRQLAFPSDVFDYWLIREEGDVFLDIDPRVVDDGESNFVEQAWVHDGDKLRARHLESDESPEPRVIRVSLGTVSSLEGLRLHICAGSPFGIDTFILELAVERSDL